MNQTEKKSRDDEFLDRVRTAYRQYPSYQVGLPPLQQRSGSRQRRMVAVFGAAAAVAIIPVIGIVVATSGANSNGASETLGSSTRASTDTPGNNHPSEPAETHPRQDGNPHLSEDLYAVFDAHPTYGFYMLQISDADKVVTLFRSTPDPAIEGSVASLVDDSGYTLAIKDMPAPSSWPEPAQENLSNAANAMKGRLNEAPESGLVNLKIEVPLNTIVLWRTSPNEATDQALRNIADKAEVQLELHKAPASETTAEDLGRRLNDDNAKWRDLGFTVNGAYATGSGVVVVITGNAAAARSTLADNTDVFAIEKDDGVPLSGTR